MEKVFYTTIQDHITHEIPKIKWSRFIGNIFPVKTKEEVEKTIQEIKKIYPDASHHCYAYKFGVSLQKDIFNNTLCTTTYNKISDDGEPGNTAGKPIMNALEKSWIQDCLIIVTRYFWWTLLWVWWLIQAYGECAKKTIETAKKKEEEIITEITFSYTFEQTQQIRNVINKYQGKIKNETYEKNISTTITINSWYQEAFRDELKDCSKWTIHI